MDGISLMNEQAVPVVEQAMQMAITEAEIKTAEDKRLQYVSEKQGYDEMLRSNQRWYQLRHWGDIRPGKPRGGEPPTEQPELEAKTGWLLRSIDARHADAMDGFPTCNILAREEMDAVEAKTLSSVVPAILEQNHFEDVYDDLQTRKILDGTGVYGVFWDGSADAGIGEISIRSEDLLNLAWDFNVRDIQDSENLFYYRERPIESVRAEFPQFAERIVSLPMQEDYDVPGIVKNRFGMVTVVDWYYKRIDTATGRRILHLAKYCMGCLLFASENSMDEAGMPMYPNGWYEHGMYPFILDAQHKMAASPLGIGLVTVGKTMQEFIDRGDTAFMKSLLWASEPRYLAKDGSINEQEFLDFKKHIVHYTQNKDSIEQIVTQPIPASFINIWQAQIDALRETTGSNEVSTGGTVSGVTAASAIAAMQEAAGKTSRDTNRGSYRAFRKVIEMVIELMRQFYELPHYYRVAGQESVMEMLAAISASPEIMPELAKKLNGSGEQYAAYTNARLMARKGPDGVFRRPLFDVQITAEKASPYTKMAANELALSFYQGGFFNPANGAASLAALEMMDFDSKQKMQRIILQNYLGFMQAQAAVAAQGGGMIEEDTQDGKPEQEALGGDGGREPDLVTKAKERAAATTQV